MKRIGWDTEANLAFHEVSRGTLKQTLHFMRRIPRATKANLALHGACWVGKFKQVLHPMKDTEANLAFRDVFQGEH